MKPIKVRLDKKPYNILVGINTLKSLGRHILGLGIGKDAYVITNALIKNKYGNTLSEVLKDAGISVKFRLIPDTEKSKSLTNACSLIKDLACYDRKKQVFIIAFGGGVVGDLAGFIASIYKRGISYIQVPTTLLAQVDSAIGGKTAVDLIQGKNLIGTFYQPRLVLSDVGMLKTLDQRQLRSGLAEVIKYGVIKDPQLFGYLEKKYKDIFDLKPDALEFIVSRCSFIKAKIIESDVREEKGLRTALNFGHTIGHAIEAAGNYKRYNHGEAVALGMIAAALISNRLGIASDKTTHRLVNVIRLIGLPSAISGISSRRIINAHYRDKKFIGGKNKFVLIEDIGKTKIVSLLPQNIINSALKKIY